MENIITDEDKIYLRRVCNYIRSLGMEYGEIILDFDQISIEDINWEWVTHFENHYGAEIPEGLKPILEKIINSIDTDEFDSDDYDSIDYERIEIIIRAKQRELTVMHEIGYTEQDEGSSFEWDSENDAEETEKLFEKLNPLFNGTRILRIMYNGGGDSGWIEGNFDGTRIEIPDLVEKWCYDELESKESGWEINEGSSGYFEFEKDGEIDKITLVHFWNESKYDSNTLFELEF